MILTVAASWSRQVANRCCGGVSDATSCRTISSPMPRLAPVTTILRAFTDILTENERCQTTYESCARTKLHVESPTRPWRDIGHWWYLHSTLEILTTTITYDHGHITPVQCAFRGDHYEIWEVISKKNAFQNDVCRKLGFGNDWRAGHQK